MLVQDDDIAHVPLRAWPRGGGACVPRLCADDRDRAVLSVKHVLEHGPTPNRHVLEGERPGRGNSFVARTDVSICTIGATAGCRTLHSPRGRSASAYRRNRLTHERPESPRRPIGIGHAAHRAQPARRNAQVSGMNNRRPGQAARRELREMRAVAFRWLIYSAWSVLSRDGTRPRHPVYRAGNESITR